MRICKTAFRHYTLAIIAAAILLTLSFTAAYAGGNLGDVGVFHKWHKVEVVLNGPSTSVTADPNPFAISVNVTFKGPRGEFAVPAFYDGDGQGGEKGSVWKVRFCPNATGKWTFASSSENADLNGYQGSFTVDEAPKSSPLLLKQGLLRYVGGCYLKFTDGPYWIKGGIDDPENFLGTPFGSWDGKKKAIDFIVRNGVNSAYVMLNTIEPGDGNDTWPWLGNTPDEAKANSSRFNVAKLLQWEDFFDYCEFKGVVLHILFDDDSVWHEYDRNLYYREMIARFGHHPAIIWNIGEEADENYTDSEIISFASLIKKLDAYNHPLTVHRRSSTKEAWPFIGNKDFDLTSIQVDDGGGDLTTYKLQNLNAVIKLNREAGAAAKRPIPVMIDEIAGVTEVNDATRLKMRSDVLYPIYLAGGEYEMHYFPGDVSLEGMKLMLDDMRIAREFVEAFPFTEMSPSNELLSSRDGNYCFAKPGRAYTIYLRDARSVKLNLTGSKGSFLVKWYNVTTGASKDGPIVRGGNWVSLGTPAYPGDIACAVTNSPNNFHLHTIRSKLTLVDFLNQTPK